jgi:hypothetical protein
LPRRTLTSPLLIKKEQEASLDSSMLVGEKTFLASIRRLILIL